MVELVASAVGSLRKNNLSFLLTTADCLLPTADCYSTRSSGPTYGPNQSRSADRASASGASGSFFAASA